MLVVNFLVFIALVDLCPNLVILFVISGGFTIYHLHVFFLMSSAIGYLLLPWRFAIQMLEQLMISRWHYRQSFGTSLLSDGVSKCPSILIGTISVLNNNMTCNLHRVYLVLDYHHNDKSNGCPNVRVSVHVIEKLFLKLHQEKCLQFDETKHLMCSDNQTPLNKARNYQEVNEETGFSVCRMIDEKYRKLELDFDRKKEVKEASRPAAFLKLSPESDESSESGSLHSQVL